MKKIKAKIGEQLEEHKSGKMEKFDKIDEIDSKIVGLNAEKAGLKAEISFHDKQIEKLKTAQQALEDE